MNMKSIELDHWGVAKSPDGLWFLEQKGSSQNARSLNVRSPFVVRTYRRNNCPHDISVDNRTLSDHDIAIGNSLRNSKAGEIFLPLPIFGEQVYFAPSENLNLIAKLTELSSPTISPIIPTWRFTQGEARAQSRLTNVMPLIVTQVSVRWMSQNDHLFDMPFTRPVILVGDPYAVLPSHVHRLEFEDMDLSGDLPAIGGAALRSFMREEYATS